MDVEPWPLCQQGADFVMFVSAVTVDDQVHVEFERDLLVHPPQETQELLVPVPGFALGDHRTGGHVQGSEQGSAPPSVVTQEFL